MCLRHIVDEIQSISGVLDKIIWGCIWKFELSTIELAVAVTSSKQIYETSSICTPLHTPHKRFAQSEGEYVKGEAGEGLPCRLLLA